MSVSMGVMAALLRDGRPKDEGRSDPAAGRRRETGHPLSLACAPGRVLASTSRAGDSPSTARITSVGRYYDPATDQFLSIDPDVAETGQPYAFTGDDPLNATDPLGLSGGSQGYVNYLKKYGCYGHGRRACHGLSIASIAKKIARGVAKVSTAVGHADVAVVKYEASHPLQIAEASVGAVLLATPGAEIAGARSKHRPSQR